MSDWQRKWIRLDAHCTELLDMSQQAEKFAGRWFKNRPQNTLLVLAGENGTGKSHVARALCGYARESAFSAWEYGAKNDGWKRIPSVIQLRWPEVVDGFKEGQYGVVEDCFNAGLLVLDDIGAEHDPSRNGVDKLCQVLSRREYRFTVVTTNIAPRNWAERFDNRVADRLMRNSVVCDLFAVESYALRKAA